MNPCHHHSHLTLSLWKCSTFTIIKTNLRNHQKIKSFGENLPRRFYPEFKSENFNEKRLIRFQIREHPHHQILLWLPNRIHKDLRFCNRSTYYDAVNNDLMIRWCHDSFLDHRFLHHLADPGVRQTNSGICSFFYEFNSWAEQTTPSKTALEPFEHNALLHPVSWFEYSGPFSSALQLRSQLQQRLKSHPLILYELTFCIISTPPAKEHLSYRPSFTHCIADQRYWEYRSFVSSKYCDRSLNSEWYQGLPHSIVPFLPYKQIAGLKLF